jgi:hypothetical protein
MEMRNKEGDQDGDQLGDNRGVWFRKRTANKWKEDGERNRIKEREKGRDIENEDREEREGGDGE